MCVSECMENNCAFHKNNKNDDEARAMATRPESTKQPIILGSFISLIFISTSLGFVSFQKHAEDEKNEKKRTHQQQQHHV